MTGFELDAGQDSRWLAVDNLNKFHGISIDANAEVTFLALE